MREFLRFLFFLLLIASLIVVGVLFYAIRFLRTSAPALPSSANVVRSGEVVFVIEPGETTAGIAHRLAEQNLIRAIWPIPADWLFRTWAWVRGMDGRLEAGRHVLRYGMTLDEILEALAVSPTVEEITFTIREGLRLEEVAEVLEAQDVMSAEEFLEAVKQPYDYDFLADRPEGASLEGYIFPDTYTVPRTYTPTQVVDFILQNFDRQFDAEMRQEVQVQGRTVYEVVTLASIVEREAVVDAERPIIAGVFLNRLKAGWPLAADPTVQYALGYNARQGTWWPVLYFDELGIESLDEIDSPYNTYRYAGLPPGPICNPGLASLRAALQPAQTDYYFFVAKNDGSGEHAFARTAEEHAANVARYQR
ncbi:MAG: endolytic transglycosylase MltG [Chloroflexia bacterium]